VVPLEIVAGVSPNPTTVTTIETSSQVDPQLKRLPGSLASPYTKVSAIG